MSVACVAVDGVLAEVVERDQQPRPPGPGHGDRVLGSGARDEAGDDRTGHGGGLDHVPDPLAPGIDSSTAAATSTSSDCPHRTTRRRTPGQVNATAPVPHLGTAAVTPGFVPAWLAGTTRSHSLRPHAGCAAGEREADMSGTELGKITTDIPARMDRSPWSRWHWLVVHRSRDRLDPGRPRGHDRRLHRRPADREGQRPRAAPRARSGRRRRYVAGPAWARCSSATSPIESAARSCS